ncbi:MAG: SUMF1/EgtB/PvdO family nonheme iron enzyme [Magnetococcales bacterium]|nr:SUMF1/EgtB/PvdO family nonheme iron enzyme [Magnetococcales bacterium]
MVSLSVGDRIAGQYAIKEWLGAGGSGAVYLADQYVEDHVVRSDVAIKLIELSDELSEEEIGEKIKEIKLAMKWNHSSLLPTYDAGRGSIQVNQLETHFLYLVMPTAEPFYKKRFSRGTPLPELEARPVFESVIRGLEFLHKNETVHRDIKPENVMEWQDRWVLVDFGLGRELINKSHTRTHQQLGTWRYMPPEGFSDLGIISPAWDIWSLGMMIVEVLTGNNLLKGKREVEILNEMKDRTAPMQWPSLPAPWEEVVNGCLALDRAKRWTARQILARLADGKSPTISPPPAPPPSVSRPPIIDITAPTVAESAVSQEDTAFATWIEPVTGMEFIKIPGGRFLMGSPDSEAERNEDEGPQHWVELDGFWMGKYPVTQAEWEALGMKNESKSKGKRNPVETVSWHQAREFIDKLNERTPEVFALPSEAQWEYVCRAGTATPFSFGETISTDQANYDGNYVYGKGTKGIYREKTTPVGMFPPNPWGLCDMHGNVWEWCEDWYDAAFYGRPEAVERNPLCKNSANGDRVLRGGSWSIDPRGLRSAQRFWNRPDYRVNWVGFRLVRLPQD